MGSQNYQRLLLELFNLFQIQAQKKHRLVSGLISYKIIFISMQQLWLFNSIKGNGALSCKMTFLKKTL